MGGLAGGVEAEKIPTAAENAKPIRTATIEIGVAQPR